jgi:signal transduction histidine kinase
MSGNRVQQQVLQVAAASLGATMLIVVIPDLRFAYRNPDLHVALLSVESLIGLLAAALAAERFKRRGRLPDLLLWMALLALSLSTLLFAAVPAVFADATSVFSTWSALVGRLVGAVLLAAAALVPDRRVRPSQRRLVRAVLANLAVLGLIAVAIAALDVVLPRGIDPLATPERSGTPRLEGHWAILGVQLVNAALYASAAYGFLRCGARRRDPFLGSLAVASTLAACAALNYFLFPSAFTEHVYTGDAFRLAFYLVMLVATAREIRASWEGAARAATLEERRRAARDLHDGLAQELASIRRNLQWLDPDDQFVARAAAASERALAEARRAIAALSQAPDNALHDALAQTATAVAQRDGTRVSLDLARTVRVEPPEGEALRLIAAEAISNAARHGGADVVHVRLEDGPRVRLVISDHGRGFDPDATARRGDGGFGLESMRQRAERVGGEFRVRSEPGSGTKVEVTL